MRHAFLMIVVLMMFGASGLVTKDALPTVSLYRSGRQELTADVQAKLADWSLAFLKTANFNTANQPAILKQTVADIQKHYRDTIMGNYLVVTYDHPITVATIGGDVNVCEIIVGLSRRDQFASALFTVDPEGRIVAHEKYGAMLPPELATP